MNMKRIFALLLMVLLFIPVFAAADIYIKPADRGVVQDIGGTTQIRINKSGATIVFDNEINDGGVVIDKGSDDVGSVKLELIGTNSVIVDTDYTTALMSYLPLTIVGNGSLICKSQHTYGTALGVAGDLTIQSGKTTAEGDLFGILVDSPDAKFTFLGDELTAKGSDDLGAITYTDDNGEMLHSFVLPGAPTVPDGYVFKAWSVNGKEMKPGEKVDTTGDERISVKPVFEARPTPQPPKPDDDPEVNPTPQPPQPDDDPEEKPLPQLPQTGDESSIALWATLVFASLLGMMYLIRKRNAA